MLGPHAVRRLEKEGKVGHGTTVPGRQPPLERLLSRSRRGTLKPRRRTIVLRPALDWTITSATRRSRAPSISHECFRARGGVRVAACDEATLAETHRRLATSTASGLSPTGLSGLESCFASSRGRRGSLRPTCRPRQTPARSCKRGGVPRGRRAVRRRGGASGRADPVDSSVPGERTVRLTRLGS